MIPERPEVPDEVLLERWSSGDPSASDELVRRYGLPIYYYFHRRVHEGAEDLAQQTFLRAIESRSELRNRASFRSFLFAIARNLLRLRFRSEAVRRTARLPEASKPVASPSTLLREHEERAIVEDAIATLPDDLRVTIELFYWEGMKTAEIADVLGVSGGTVRWRLSTGRTRLREEIARRHSAAS